MFPQKIGDNREGKFFIETLEPKKTSIVKHMGNQLSTANNTGGSNSAAVSMIGNAGNTMYDGLIQETACNQ